jgi:alanine racemase
MAYIEIDKKNLYHNLNQIAIKTSSVDKIAVVLKDNAYGHGLDIIAQLCSEYGIKHAVVKNYTEALAIKELFDTILVLNDKIIFDDKIYFAINSLEDISKAEKYSNIELKVDTGMHRNGISIDELEEALLLIQQRRLKLVGVMSHFRSADELSSEFFWQHKSFEKIKKYIRDKGFKDIRFHSYNSASILRSNSFSDDLVRVGIAIYGYSELPNLYNQIELKPVMKLYANRVSSRKLLKGQRLGYGGDFIADKNMLVSTYDIGYGDGWCRNVNDKVYLLNGLEILGRVSMDFISLESRADKICIFDNVKEIAKNKKTITYEILTSLNSNIDRKVI